ncbi:hypothetical protein SO3561_09069 [Streptomyces olivochromogenes]|uniref:Uncharacterized protein n=1 Tax=Streptomyces olivochromogenes TaxID=1963 RepID=A0A250VTT2_STROL|nr:hypothetical protein SO3561_09069 [Streptomyces olivochromogenes]
MERGREGVQLCLHAVTLDALVVCAQPIPWNRSSSGPRGGERLVGAGQWKLGAPEVLVVLTPE